MYQANLILKILMFLTIFSTIVRSESVKKLYEQQCNIDSDCNSELGLSCQNKVCKCDQSGATVHSLARNRCVGAAGRECLQSQNETFCVSNSKCHNYGYMLLCTCREGYYQSKDGNCYPVARYGDPCLEEDFSCGDSVSTSIGCLDKKCRCILGEENQYYLQNENKCVSFIGGRCIPHYYQPCPNNSYCGEYNEDIGGASFMAGLKCTCLSGYSSTRGRSGSRQCLGGYGTSCGIDSPCNYDEFLGCMNSKCQCRNPLNEVFNEQTQQCNILVGSVCSMDSQNQNAQRCVDHAACVQEKGNNTSKFGRCQCGQGYSSTPLNQCLLDINQKCESGQCNFHNGLACVNETCNCIDSFLSFDKVSKSCVSLVSHPCGVVSLLHEGQDRETTVYCEANSVCSKIGGNGNSMAKRVCKPSTTKN